MSEQEIVRKCTEAFPGIEKDNHDFPIKELLKSNTPQQTAGQEKMLKELGLHSTGSMLIDLANSARVCGERLRNADEQAWVKETVGSVETKLAEAALNGKSEVTLMSLGKGIARVGNAFYDPPEMKAAHKQIYDGINNSRLFKAELKADPNKKDEFLLVASLKAKR